MNPACSHCRRRRMPNFAVSEQRDLRRRSSRFHVQLLGWLEGKDLRSEGRSLRARDLQARRDLSRPWRRFYVPLSTGLGGCGLPHSVAGVREQSLRKRSNVRQHGGRKLSLRMSRGIRRSKLSKGRGRLSTFALPERWTLRRRS